jgi:lipid-A-disaccharide synthase
MKFFFVAGEASGDARGAEVMQALLARDPATSFAGRGGPRMQAVSSGTVVDWIEHAAVIGFLDVIRNYPFFRRQFQLTLEQAAEFKPDAVVLVDYPGFNLRLARALKKQGLATRVIYYISPQVWAWNQRRIPMMAKSIDLMLCIFPFEKSLYEKSNLRTEFVGHPLLDSLAAEKRHVARDPNLIGLFPGSREREVRKIFPIMLRTAAMMQRNRQHFQFEAAAASEKAGRLMSAIASEENFIGCKISAGSAHDLMQRAAAGMIASGTATLEAAYFRLPYVLLYRTAWLTFALGRRLVKVKHLGIVNILAGREVVREFLQNDAVPEKIMEELFQLLDDKGAKLSTELETVVALLGAPGASDRAAAAILDYVQR